GAVVREPFDGGEGAAGNRGDLARARLRRHAVNQHHAGAALLQAAAETASAQAKILAQDGEQRTAGIDPVEADGLAVEDEFNGHDSCWKRAACSVTSPRVRGEVGFRAERSDGIRVRGRFRESELVETPLTRLASLRKSSARKSTSLRTAGEVEQAARESPERRR